MTKHNQSSFEYQIRMSCHIEKHQRSWFDDLSVTNLDNGECMLVGPIADQAELFGILLKVRDLGMILISIDRIQKSD